MPTYSDIKVTSGPSLRDALRGGTDTPHRDLDLRLSKIDITQPGGLQQFLSIQRRGFRKMALACDWKAAEGTRALRDMIEALDRDLPTDRHDLPSDRPSLHPDAIAYVTLGSQLGTRVLRNSISDDTVSAYFTLPPDTVAWRTFCLRMSAARSDDARGKRTIDDAARAFGFFRAALDLYTTETEIAVNE